MQNMETSDESQTQPMCTSDDIMNTAFVDRLKVAAAAAIIKQKPESMTGKEYAKLLALKLHERENSWKAKAKQLERELLKTRQELVLVKANLPDRKISKDSRRKQICSSSDSSSTGEDAFLTPPSSSSSDLHYSDLEGVLSANTKFLHSLSCLSVASDPEAKLELACPEVIIESVRSAADYILGGLNRESSTSGTSSKLAQQAVESLAKVVDSHAASGCRMELVAITTKLVEGILGEMLRTSNMCNVHSLQESSSLICHLAKSHHLCPIIIQIILQKIEKVSASLRNTSHYHGHHLSVGLFENSYFLFSALEDILITKLAPSSSLSSQLCQRGSHLGEARQVSSSSDGEGNASASLCSRNRSRSSAGALALTQGFRTNILQRLEDSLLHLSHDFPLYAQYIWRLTGILDMMNEQ